jgi:hypothetical protein
MVLFENAFGVVKESSLVLDILQHVSDDNSLRFGLCASSPVLHYNVIVS